MVKFTNREREREKTVREREIRKLRRTPLD